MGRPGLREKGEGARGNFLMEGVALRASHWGGNYSKSIKNAGHYLTGTGFEKQRRHLGDVKRFVNEADEKKEK